MYAFTQDGKHLVIQDGFGLTRVTFPKSVKTDRALGGNKLSLGGNHVLAFAAKSHKFALRTADALLNERWAASNYGSFALHPDDGHAIAQPPGELLGVVVGPGHLRAAKKDAKGC